MAQSLFSNIFLVALKHDLSFSKVRTLAEWLDCYEYIPEDNRKYCQSLEYEVLRYCQEFPTPKMQPIVMAAGFLRGIGSHLNYSRQYDLAVKINKLTTLPVWTSA